MKSTICLIYYVSFAILSVALLEIPSLRTSESDSFTLSIRVPSKVLGNSTPLPPPRIFHEKLIMNLCDIKLKNSRYTRKYTRFHPKETDLPKSCEQVRIE